MPKPLRHTKHEIECAAKAAAQNNLVVRLEEDGAIVFSPAIHNQSANINNSSSINPSNKIKEWD